MYSVKLDINPLIYEHIMFFLKNLPKNMVTVHSTKKKSELKTKIDIDSLPSSVDKYVGIVNENEVDLDYKNSRADYLAEKYL